MKNLFSFLKHYPAVGVITILLSVIGYHLFSGHADNLMHNSALAVAGFYLLYLAIAFVAFLYVINQWNLFKKSDWFEK